MKTIEVAYSGQKEMKVVLEEEITEMEQVNVISTGYYDIDKSKMTGAVEVVTAREIAGKGYTSIDEVLRGTLAGVSVMNVSGRPGAQAQTPYSWSEFFDRKYGADVDCGWYAYAGEFADIGRSWSH